MSTKWRPDGWKNPYEMEKLLNGEKWGYTYAGYTEEYDSFEDGANTMLEKLRKLGQHDDKRPFTLVFIPDETEAS